MGQLREAVRAGSVIGAVVFVLLSLLYAYLDGKGRWIEPVSASLGLACAVLALIAMIPVHRKDSS